MLVGYATGLSRLELYLDYERPLTLGERDCLREAIRRRDTGEPLQYIIGQAPFRHLTIAARPGVLIPRPETEMLVDLVLSVLPANAQVLEIGTGSGCIALALVDQSIDCQVLATDNSAVAVQLAQENLQHWLEQPTCFAQCPPTPRLQIIQDDLASSLLANNSFLESFDVLVSNPPYIPSAEIEKLPEEVWQFEPRCALDGGIDGLAVFSNILEQGKSLLKSAGLLACELHQDTLQQAASLASASNYYDVQIHDDLAGRSRFLSCRRG